MARGALWGHIDGRPIYLPIVAQEINLAALSFAVPAADARRLVPDAFDLVEVDAGVAELVVAAHDYRRGDWGSCQTVNLGIKVRPAGCPDAPAGPYLSPAPMSPSFGREAAHRALGFTKLTADIHVDYGEDVVRFAVASDLTLSIPRVRTDRAPMHLDMVVYSHGGGRVQVVRLALDVPVGLADPDAVEIELGRGPAARVLRRLGLPGRPQRAVWGEGSTGVFHAPEPVTTRSAEPAHARR